MATAAAVPLEKDTYPGTITQSGFNNSAVWPGSSLGLVPGIRSTVRPMKG